MDAAEIKPKFVPTESLLPRDNSGGIDDDGLEYTAQFGDGGKTTGKKSYLSAGGGSNRSKSDEQPMQKKGGKGDD